MNLLEGVLLLIHTFIGLYVLISVLSAFPKQFIFKGAIGNAVCFITIFLSLLGPAIMYNYNPKYLILTIILCFTVLLAIKFYSMKAEPLYRLPSIFKILDEMDEEVKSKYKDKDEPL